MFQFTIPESTSVPIKASKCKNCGHDFYKKKGDKNEYCSTECNFSHKLELAELERKQIKRAQERKRKKEEQIKKREIEEQRDIIRTHCPPCDQARRKLDELQLANYRGGMRGGATEITDNTLEKKLIDATAPYNEKAARNAENFAKASIEVGKSILDQLELDPLAFINKAKALGIKITEITKEGIFLLFPGDASMGESVDKLIKSGTKLYFLPVRILGTIAITIFLSMFDVFIPLKFLEKIRGLKPFIDLIMKYTAIIPTILKNLKIPNLSFGSLIDSDVMDASYLRKGSRYEYKPTRNTEGGRKKKRRTRRKKIGGMHHGAPTSNLKEEGARATEWNGDTIAKPISEEFVRAGTPSTYIRPSDRAIFPPAVAGREDSAFGFKNPQGKNYKVKKEKKINPIEKLKADAKAMEARTNKKKGGKKKRKTRHKKRRKN